MCMVSGCTLGLEGIRGGKNQGNSSSVFLFFSGNANRTYYRRKMIICYVIKPGISRHLLYILELHIIYLIHSFNLFNILKVHLGHFGHHIFGPEVIKHFVFIH
jgi:hypothetical protein